MENAVQSCPDNSPIAASTGQEKVYVDQYLLECGEEELTEIQSDVYKKNGEVFEFARAITSIQNTQKPKETTTVRSTPSSVAVSSPATTSQIFIPSKQNGLANGGYVVVDSNVKLMVAPLPPTSSSRTVRLVPPMQLQSNPPLAPRVVVPQVRAQSVNKVAKNISTPNSTLLGALSSVRPRLATTSTLRKTPIIYKSAKTTPSVTSSQNGPIVDLTEEEMEDAVEEIQQFVPGAGLGGKKDLNVEKTYPSLAVTARTSLCNKMFSQALMNAERLHLDNKMRRVLSMNPPVFTEHLLQQRLLKCEQVCSEHTGNKLKLGMYSDTTRFPYSGGYVWIADCCPGTFSSVFRGSIFEIGPHPPSVILKLMYHWACQTCVSNVLQWVKVDNTFLKTFYTYLRGVCTAAIHEKYEIMGGPSRKIEIGVISLGTSSGGTGGVREVKVDILGIMDYEAKKLRLRAFDHITAADPSARNSDMHAKKFQRILEILKKWVHPSSTIVTDFSVDGALSVRSGFSNMVQSSAKQPSNTHIMEYLRFCVPRMFQNTLNLLSRHIIQQFLDELVWRETWGQIPSRAYECIIEHLAEQTRLDGPEDLSVRYTLITSNPYKDWKYTLWPKNMSQAKITKNQPLLTSSSSSQSLTNNQTTVSREKPTSSTLINLSPTAPDSHTDTDEQSKFPELAKIALEPYYYGTILGDPSKQKPTGLFGASLTDCSMCGKDFYSSCAFTDHLVHHALNSNEEIRIFHDNVLRLACRFCMRPLSMLESHVKEYHNQSHLTNKNMCKICNIILKDSNGLISHMTATHCELDMPYFCELCQYRTSIYQDMLTHFKKFHDKDTCVQCPYCLKVVRFATRSGEDIHRNQLYFVQHIQKHNFARQVKKCEKCALSFTSLSTLRNHQEYFHVTCAEFDGVERYDCNPNDFTLMAAPLTDPAPPMSLVVGNQLHTHKGKPLPPSIDIPDDLKMFLCAECDGPISIDHFSIQMTCTKCLYQTSCANAIEEHNASCHQVKTPLKRSNIVGGRPFLSKPLYCLGCMFVTSNGNSMAHHLTTCSPGIAISDKRKAALMVEDDFVELEPRKRKKQE